MTDRKSYLGDAVYVDTDGYHPVILTTEDGIRATNTIYLDDRAWSQLVSWVERQKQRGPLAMGEESADGLHQDQG